MKTIELLTQQVKDAHQLFLGTLEGITNDQANFKPQGKALSVAATWVHHVEAEDAFMSAVDGQPTLESTDFAGKTGFQAPQPMADWETEFPKWAQSLVVDVEPLMAYTKAAFAKTEAAVAQLTDEDLDKSHSLGSMGEPTAFTIISSYIIGHCYCITGEMSAVKGTEGLKGYPF